MSLTQQDNANLFIMLEKIGYSMFPIKTVLEIEIQTHELQTAAKMINPVCIFLGHKSFTLVHKWLLFLQNKSITFLLSGFNFKGIIPHAIQRTKCYQNIYFYRRCCLLVS